MSKAAHFVYLSLMTLLVIFTLIILVYYGYSYYQTDITERFFHENHLSLKPSGSIGHGLGIIGTLFMLVGVFFYMARKRFRSLSRLGVLKYWLEFHIFMCTLGPVLVLFHTAFKFGGIVSVSFWSMVAVFLSGVAGRFIYLQIPRSIEGRELSLNEIREMKTDLGMLLSASSSLDQTSREIIIQSAKRSAGISAGNLIQRTYSGWKADRKTVSDIQKVLKKNKLSQTERKSILKIVRDEISMNRRISRLQTMLDLFKYWHVAHLPFAIIMLIIMIIHVVVTIVFGFKWIF